MPNFEYKDGKRKMLFTQHILLIFNWNFKNVHAWVNSRWC